MNNIGKPHISITGSNRIKKINKRSSEPAPAQTMSATDSAAALASAVAADMETPPAKTGTIYLSAFQRCIFLLCIFVQERHQPPPLQRFSRLLPEDHHRLVCEKEVFC